MRPTASEEIERKRKRYIYIYIYIYTNTCTYMRVPVVKKTYTLYIIVKKVIKIGKLSNKKTYICTFRNEILQTSKK